MVAPPRGTPLVVRSIDNLAVLPTPVQRMDALAVELGTDAHLVVKRDDLTGLALGGNKARKLAFLAADALANDADCLVTGGGPQSNHARMTAAAANQIGLDCHLALAGPPSAARDGNLLLDELLGAQLHFDGASDYYDIEQAITTLADSLRATGRRPYAIPVGGASTLGVVAYALAVDELRDQLGDDPDWIFVADGSGGTHAGILAGLGDAVTDHGRRRRRGDASRPRRPRARNSRSAAATHLGRGAPLRRTIIDHDHIGRGYGDLSPACLEALRTVARAEGLILDPVYSGKAAAAMFTAVRDGRISNGDTVVFWATGGSPALFAHHYESALTGP